eukprot:352905-Chlamydomonas_euryale.AAC.2
MGVCGVCGHVVSGSIRGGARLYAMPHTNSQSLFPSQSLSQLCVSSTETGTLLLGLVLTLHTLYTWTVHTWTSTYL